MDSTKCVPIVDDPDGVGEPCQAIDGGGSGLDTCELHSLCWNVDASTQTGACISYCVGSPDSPTCDDDCAGCSIPSSGVLALCLSDCDAIAQDCPQGQACYPLSDGFTCAPNVPEPGMGQAGQPCQSLNTCAAGTFCLNPDLYPTEACADEDGCCTPTCIVGDPTACIGAPEGVECLPWFEDGEAPPPTPGCGTSSDFGICGRPPA